MVTNMIIALVGHFPKYPDEGVRILARYLASELAKQNELITVSIPSVASWRRMKGFRPDIIHYILSPTTIGIIVAKLFSIIFPEARTVISAPHPDCVIDSKWMILFRPDVILVQSYQSEKMFRNMGYRTRFLPNGVDVNRFVPVSVEKKEELRERYNVPLDKFVILHIASLKVGRNLEVLKKLQQLRDNIQVVIVGRNSEHRDEYLAQELRQAGCYVWTRYLPHIEEVYSLSDCYIFPTTDRRYAIEMPFSVMEAMACNLPVITTRFGALPRVLCEGDGLFFVENQVDLYEAVEDIESENIETKTRGKVLPYSWENIVKRLVEIYGELV